MIVLQAMKILLILFLTIISCNCLAQQFVKGVVTDEKGSPITNAKIFIKNDVSQRTVADLAGKYLLSLMPGEYFLVFSSSGFEDREKRIFPLQA